jgi:predicted ferric reductase
MTGPACSHLEFGVMAAIRTTFLSLTIATIILWLAAAWPLPLDAGFFPIRATAVQFTGALAMTAMIAAVILAARWPWVEARLKGLDKAYRLHKWLGIAALVAATTHWLWAQGPKWAGQLGLGLGRPVRVPPPPPVNVVEATFRSWRGFAEGLGEWAFYGAAVLIALALIHRFPYHLFRKTHLLLAPIFLALAFHAAVLLDFKNWASPFGLVFGAGLALACVVAVLSLFRRIGAGRKVATSVAQIERFPALGVIAATLSAPQGWPGHKAGQFAFATSNPSEGPHPYTIASAWDPQTKTIRVIAKALGDHTRRVFDTLQVGAAVTLEGPYGAFTFDDGAPTQIWIGAGIGITPFIARMEALAAMRDAGHDISQRVTLFHPTAEEDEPALALLRRDADRAGVALHILVDRKDGRLTGERIRAAVPDWRQASLWFCGPARFGDALRADFRAGGVDVARNFHQELFQMR